MKIGSETDMPNSVKSCRGRRIQCRPIVIHVAGRALCLQRALNSSTVVDRCSGEQSACALIAACAQLYNKSSYRAAMLRATTSKCWGQALDAANGGALRRQAVGGGDTACFGALTM